MASEPYLLRRSERSVFLDSNLAIVVLVSSCGLKNHLFPLFLSQMPIGVTVVFANYLLGHVQEFRIDRPDCLFEHRTIGVRAIGCLGL